MKKCYQCHKLINSKEKGVHVFCSPECIGKWLVKKSRTSTCSFCRTSFTPNKERQKFCSVQCLRNFQQENRQSLECLCCGKICVYEKRRRCNANKFCSHQCAAIFASLNTTLSDPNLPMHNLRYKYKAFVFYGFKCMRCGWDQDARVLAVHHKHGKRNGNGLDNLEVLCPTCHAKEHYKGGSMWRKQIRAVTKIQSLYFENEKFRKLFIRLTGSPIHLKATQEVI